MLNQTKCPSVGQALVSRCTLALAIMKRLRITSMVLEPSVQSLHLPLLLVCIIVFCCPLRPFYSSPLIGVVAVQTSSSTVSKAPCSESSLSLSVVRWFSFEFLVSSFNSISCDLPLLTILVLLVPLQLLVHFWQELPFLHPTVPIMVSRT